MSGEIALQAHFSAPFAPSNAEHADIVLARLRFDPGVDAKPFLRGAFGCAPYLGRLALSRESGLEAMLMARPEDTLAGILDRLRRAGFESVDTDDLNRRLRLEKVRLHLLTALSDLSGAWSLNTVSRAMTAAADAAIASAFQAHARFLAESGRAPAEAVTQDGLQGVFVIALGKLGSEELNYSSDVDLAVFYEGAALRELGVEDPSRLCVRLTRRAMASLEDRTADGYVFRTDLRLRPDPGSSPLALNVEAAMNYYESFALTWERAAWIKARACAGDLAAAERFLGRMKPFVWRRTIDFGSIEEIEGLMTQIHRAAGDVDGAAGFDLKRGLGGMRRIEFYAQTQQLLYGGRDESLRARSSIQALIALRDRGDIEAETYDQLVTAYEWLRVTENRLQMIEDQHTHHVPEQDDERATLAALRGYELADFDAALLSVTRPAEAICRNLFEAPSQDPREAGLMFDGPDPAPEGVRRLMELGFERPGDAWSRVRNWLLGKPRATRSDRARRIIRRLAPRIVLAAADTGHPDAALLRFSEFLKGLSAGVTILSLFEREPELLAEVTDALGLAPRLAKALAKRPEALEAFVLPSVDVLDLENVEEAARRALTPCRDFEEALDAARRFARETLLRVAIATLRGQAVAGEAGRARARIAQAVLRALLPVVRREVESVYGALDVRIAVLGLGSLGAGAMTLRSDLDLMMVYAPGDQAASSGGQRDLPVETWCARYMQRLISALSVETTEGPLFDVDLQLRPSGAAGPVAVRLERFKRYYETEAWTWEMMAMTRARVVAGDDEALQAELAGELTAMLRRPRDAALVKSDIDEMRARIAREKPECGFWDLRRTAGGQIDLEFLVQRLQLIHAHDAPDVCHPSLFEAVSAFEAHGVMDAQSAEILSKAARLNLDLAQLLALAVEDVFDLDRAPDKLKARLASAGETEDYTALTEKLAAARRDVQSVIASYR